MEQVILYVLLALGFAILQWVVDRLRKKAGLPNGQPGPGMPPLPAPKRRDTKKSSSRQAVKFPEPIEVRNELNLEPDTARTEEFVSVDLTGRKPIEHLDLLGAAISVAHDAENAGVAARLRQAHLLRDGFRVAILLGQPRSKQPWLGQANRATY